MRKTKIICTIGPSSESEEVMSQLIASGMNVARFNFSHGDHEEHKRKLERLIKLRREMNLPITAMLDTKGPEIRLKTFRGGKVTLTEGQQFILTTDDVEGTDKKVSVTYKDLPKDVKPGSSILIDDGLIGLKVDEIKGADIICTVQNGGPLSDKKSVNIPGEDLSMPFISDQDRADLIFGCEQGFDCVAASFTRTADDIREMRYILNNNGGENMKIIAKIESVQGVRNLDEILEEADGIMVARGDLGVEVPLEDVPVLQKKIIRACRKRGKIAVTATQMLDSMIHNPRPTRAESTDVANAIYDGTSCIMLSGETANGAYPVEAVKTMAKIAERTEQDIDFSLVPGERIPEGASDITAAISHATCTVAEDIGAAAIITVTLSGFTARRLAGYRPVCPILACTTSKKTACQMNLLFDVMPLIIPNEPSADLLFEAAVNQAKRAGAVKSGDKVVLTAGVPLGVSGNTNMVRVIEVW